MDMQMITSVIAAMVRVCLSCTKASWRLAVAFRKGASSDGCTSLLVPVASEAIAALNRSVCGWLERNLTGLPAICANRIVHLARRSVTVAAIAGTATPWCALTSDTAGFATLWFVRKAFFGEKYLLVGSKGEFLPAIFADDGLVVVHLIPHS